MGGVKFRRQHQLGDYICDFYCAEEKLVVECDGDVHGTPERLKIDKKRMHYKSKLHRAGHNSHEIAPDDANIVKVVPLSELR